MAPRAARRRAAARGVAATPRARGRGRASPECTSCRAIRRRLAPYKPYEARVPKVDGSAIRLGYFQTAEDAAEAYARHLGPRGVAAAIEAIARLDARVAATAAADAPLPTIDEAGSPSPAGAVPPKKRPIAYLNS